MSKLNLTNMLHKTNTNVKVPISQPIKNSNNLNVINDVKVSYQSNKEQTRDINDDGIYIADNISTQEQTENNYKEQTENIDIDIYKYKATIEGLELILDNILNHKTLKYQGVHIFESNVLMNIIKDLIGKDDISFTFDDSISTSCFRPSIRKIISIINTNESLEIENIKYTETSLYEFFKKLGLSLKYVYTIDE